MEKNPFNFSYAEFHSKYFGLLWVKLNFIASASGCYRLTLFFTSSQSRGEKQRHLTCSMLIVRTKDLHRTNSPQKATETLLIFHEFGPQEQLCTPHWQLSSLTAHLLVPLLKITPQPKSRVFTIGYWDRFHGCLVRNVEPDSSLFKIIEPVANGLNSTQEGPSEVGTPVMGPSHWAASIPPAWTAARIAHGPRNSLKPLYAWLMTYLWVDFFAVFFFAMIKILKG